jgi:hypothetical protein
VVADHQGGQHQGGVKLPRLHSLHSRNHNLMKWQIGKVTVTRLIELESIGGKEWLLPQATPEAIGRIQWIRPHSPTPTRASR